MMYMGVIGVGLLEEMVNMNDKVDCLVLEHSRRKVGQGANIHCIQQMVAACDTRINEVEERVWGQGDLVHTLSSSWDQLEN